MTVSCWPFTGCACEINLWIFGVHGEQGVKFSSYCSNARRLSELLCPWTDTGTYISINILLQVFVTVISGKWFAMVPLPWYLCHSTWCLWILCFCNASSRLWLPLVLNPLSSLSFCRMCPAAEIDLISLLWDSQHGGHAVDLFFPYHQFWNLVLQFQPEVLLSLSLPKHSCQKVDQKGCLALWPCLL